MVALDQVAEAKCHSLRPLRLKAGGEAPCQNFPVLLVVAEGKFQLRIVVLDWVAQLDPDALCRKQASIRILSLPQSARESAAQPPPSP